MTDALPILDQVVMTGEVPCSIRQGIIALETCLKLHGQRRHRCLELVCPFVGHQGLFGDEISKAKGKPTPRKSRKKAKKRKKDPRRKVAPRKKKDPRKKVRKA